MSNIYGKKDNASATKAQIETANTQLKALVAELNGATAVNVPAIQAKINAAIAEMNDVGTAFTDEDGYCSFKAAMILVVSKDERRNVDRESFGFVGNLKGLGISVWSALKDFDTADAFEHDAKLDFGDDLLQIVYVGEDVDYAEGTDVDTDDA